MQQQKEEEQAQTQNQEGHILQTSVISKYSTGRHRIYEVTEGVDSPKTKVVYTRCLNHFLDFNPVHDKQALLDCSPKVIKEMIVDYIHWLRDEKPGKKLGRSSIKVHLAAILHFFQINKDDFTLTIKNFRIHLPSDDTVQDDRPYSREEIAQILKDCDLRSKVVFLLLCGSGLKKGAVPGLQLRDLIPMQYNGLDVYKIKVYARTRDEYYSFTTVESRKAIKDYLDYRERCHEQLTEKAPLIREQFNKDNPFTVNAPKFVTDKAIEYLIDQALKRSGVRKPGTVHMSHGCRKYFVSTCESSPMKSLHVSMLSGHNTGIKKHYHIPSESVILEDFMTHAADLLTIDKSQRLQKQVEKLEGEQAQEIARLKTKVQQQDDWLGTYHEFKESTVSLVNAMQSVLEKNGLWPKDGTKAK